MNDHSPNLRNWDDPEAAREAMRALRRRIERDSATPNSGVRMCHAQGKSAVYRSQCRNFIITHDPDGTVIRRPLARP